EINEIYFTSTPSGQTGLRVSLAFLATFQVLNPQVKVYHIDTLLLQAGTENCLSMLTIDSSGNKYHIAVYQNKKCLLVNQVIQRVELTKIKEKFPDFRIFQDFQGLEIGLKYVLLLTFKMDFLQELNEQQKQAVYEEHSRICVIAGPGCGKTKTL
ncbi:7650_t:CDS:2, partial [Racocetra persica]